MVKNRHGSTNHIGPDGGTAKPFHLTEKVKAKLRAADTDGRVKRELERREERKKVRAQQETAAQDAAKVAETERRRRISCSRVPWAFA